MSNQIYTPKLNPVRFYDINPTELPQYLSKQFGYYPFYDTQKPWNTKTRYFQKWQTSDSFSMQFESNFDPIEIQVVDCHGGVYLTHNATQVRAHKYMAGFYVYEDTISWAPFAPGIYFIKRIIGDKVQISEPIDLKEKHPHTVLYQYRNSRYHGDVIFETGITFAFRVEGTFGPIQPGSTDELYTDQLDNPFVLSSVPHDAHLLYHGGSRGLPDWAIQLINWIWSCNNVLIDGVSYAKSSDTKMEFKDQERWPMRGLSMIIREGVNRPSYVSGIDIDPTKKLSVVYNIDGTIFGDLSRNASSNLVPINTVE